ncbi:MAG: flagellar assembly protein FliH [Spirochaetes bacterium]|nr:flagellar assembly protein FliH [Spirochaetota bacterium]
MSKNVFKSLEIVPTEMKVSISAPEFHRIIPQEEDAEAELFEGKTIEQLKEERDQFEKDFEVQKQAMIAEAEAKKEEIIKHAEATAHEIIRKKTNESQEIKSSAEAEAQEIIQQAKTEAQGIEREVQEKESRILNEARKRGYEEGWDEGYGKGSEEVKRLVERIQIILDAAIKKRNDIFIETEHQIIGLVLLIAKKVIKVISENQKNVVINNVVQALRKLKSRGEVAIRVNLADLELTTQHKRDFVEMIEGVKSIKILEDSTVDRGGCIIETDFGALDARISSQLQEIEERILELMPIQSKGKSETPV